MSEAERSTRDRILAAAKEEFLSKGYQGAGLREIAKKAGVTTGALYGYFKNKEEVFRALVHDDYAYIIGTYRNVLQSFAQLPPEMQRRDMSGYTARTATQMMEYLYDHYDAFKLILCCSEGTEYSNLVRDMAQLDEEATHNFAQTAGQAGAPIKAVNPRLERILTGAMFSTFFELIVEDIPREEAPEFLQQTLDFFSGGWATIMGF